MSPWLPYDEATPNHLLRTNRDELASWLDDRRSGAMSARQARTLLSEQAGTVDAFMVRPHRTTKQPSDDAALVCHLPAPH